MENFRNYEPIWIHDTGRLLCEFVKRGNIDLHDAYNLLRTSPVINSVDVGVQQHLYRTISALTYELLVLVTENFNNNGFNLTDSSVRSFLQEIKKDLPDDMKNINATELLKSIRNSIAHNSTDIKNFNAVDHDTYELTINKKGSSSTSVQSFSPLEIHQILETYDKVRKRDNPLGSIDIDENFQGADGLLYAKKKFGTFNRAIKTYDKNGNYQELDNYQESALQRFLIKHRKLINTEFGINYLIRFIPNKDNKLNHYENKYHLMEIMRAIINSSKGIKYKELINFLKKEHPHSITPFIDEDYLKSLAESSVAFSIFSARTASEMREIAKNAGVELHEGILRHVRNSFIHGRYFYNFKSGFEIYDGTSELSHITTLTFDQINALYKEIYKEQRVHMINARINYVEENFINPHSGDSESIK